MSALKVVTYHGDLRDPMRRVNPLETPAGVFLAMFGMSMQGLLKVTQCAQVVQTLNLQILSSAFAGTEFKA